MRSPEYALTVNIGSELSCGAAPSALCLARSSPRNIASANVSPATVPLGRYST
jgi:hypothetical protein